MVHPPLAWAHWRAGLVLLAGVIGFGPAAVGGTQTGIATDPQSGVTIKISSWYEQAPFRGYAPVEVTIENHSGAARSWTMVTASPQSYGQRIEVNAAFHFAVENKERRSFRVLAPLVSEGVPYYQSLNFRFDGYGVNAMSSTSIAGTGYGSGTSTAFTVISSKLLPSGTQPLTDALRSQSRNLAGSRVEMKDLPEDWRALAGAESIYLLTEELAALGPAQRVALQDWVAAGGVLTIFGTSEIPADLRQSGFGKVRTELARKLEPAAMAQKVRERESSNIPPATDFATGAVKQWGALKEVGEVRPNALLLSFCMLAFAAVIGPVNLFFFAASHRRARLIWTVPALSVGASALLFVVIVFQDGFGGTGVRNAVICLQPERKKAVVLQEQIARTGVLTRSSFQVKESALISPLAASELGKKQANGYSISGNEFSGSWFRSRSLQAQRVEAIVPTRAEITVMPSEGGAPAVISSIDAVLEELFYRDAEGAVWMANQVAAGTRTVLRKTDNVPDDLSETASQMLTEAFTSVGVPKGAFYARTRDPKLLVPTLSSIRWERKPITIIGPVTEVGR